MRRQGQAFSCFLAALLTMARRPGHSSTTMVERVYSHLGEIRHRAEEVEFWVEAHKEELEEQLRVLRVA